MAASSESSSAAAAALPHPQAGQQSSRLFDLPPEVDSQIFPFLGSDLAIGLARLRCTSKRGKQHVDAGLPRILIAYHLSMAGCSSFWQLRADGWMAG
ncbi:unnamed protein product [Vitrella brassicaformis CCMP3155]|uniref:F-box domain-containing protein n=1 Tax=Vitrella brassicaformis (strain CCMP3155) TaxID=1169540 RepID=A0A0G4EVA9_VITBC|nr:unnamed protein product [Vitrella brassicaformis CCMP3155]|mmetsp:Transcript_43854/g.124213  ORF Transcript_43854/g.124213 Transcript_43854/m.124213 type:complete len:97 (-) Transcript_43854:80-370(-)|eukprot:CEM02278.1 unnamed protein product [Vitrella brassicaformis CCMP3155]